MQIYPQSEVHLNGTKYYLARDAATQQKLLCIDGDLAAFQGTLQAGVYSCPLTPENAAALRERLPWLNPHPLGLATSFGFGDRLGIATPGHIAAAAGTGIAPIFAQQSVRENDRTGRSPQIVLDDAMWGIFEMGWRDPWGADADHVKEIGDLPPFIKAGYTFYTIDPNEYVDNAAHTDSLETLKAKVTRLPWDSVGVSLEGLYQLYIKKPVDLAGFNLEFQEETLLRAAAKYGQAIAHIKSISDYLIKHVKQFDLEASVDETDTPTTVHEHYYIANELRRLEVPFVSLAPRFIGSFEKGVDYIGDRAEFDRELERHAAVMHQMGGYKLSIHTGSDKFSIYPSIARQARNLVHVKTAGTSYLECLRVIAAVDQPFFRELLDFARSRYLTDKATYHVSGKLEKVPAAAELSDGQLLDLFEQFDARQVLHVTFGSVLDDYGTRLLKVLTANLKLYNQFLQKHFQRHLNPLTIR
ncbi:MAG: tagaturonate epimerase family protein [Anaerolineaceae bacterium]|nr:tagaturonate epimerase family protein [Anaerolineaceae bacterium]